MSIDQAPGWAAPLIDAAATSGEDIATALKLCSAYGSRLPLPGRGATATRWAVLAGLGRANLTVARVFEAHTDALAILAENGDEVPSARTWGVFAAEAPDARLDANTQGEEVTLSGTKPWCSLGGALDAALVTARVGDERQLFRVDLRQPSVHADPPEVWVARGLRTVTSGPVHFDGAPAHAVGAAGWYLTRPGFAWGGIGVAACWHGGALGLADTVRRLASRRTGELNALHLGIIDAALHASSTALAYASARIDGGDAGDPARLALRTRAVVADSVEGVLRQAGHALGPAPLAFDADHAARVADLELYVRQHHGERDLAELGARVLGEVDPA